MSDTLLCPHCGRSIAITDAISHQLQEKLEQKFYSEKKQLEQTYKKEFEDREQAIKKEMWQKAVKAAAIQQEERVKQQATEMEELKKVLKDRDEKISDFTTKELDLIKEKRKLEDDQKAFDLKVARQIEAERKVIAEKAYKEAEESARLKILELEKKNQDTQKALDEAQRKASQGSQQTQGEVLELDLENSLHENFSCDRISPVGKGVHGADIVQTVCNRNGMECGVILWEIKHTKNWTEGWVNKLKDDLRATKANIPVIVTTVLPKDIEGFGFYNKVWVVLPSLALQLAGALRQSLIGIAFERSAANGKGEKAELLFNYVSSHEFRQRVEALVEVFQDMQGQILKERVAFEKSWKMREMQLQRLFVNTAGMYGEMQGLVGSTMPEIKGLEIEAPVQLADGESKQQLF